MKLSHFHVWIPAASQLTETQAKTPHQAAARASNVDAHNIAPIPRQPNQHPAAYAYEITGADWWPSDTTVTVWDSEMLASMRIPTHQIPELSTTT